MPNDEIELDRLDMIHEMMLTLMDRKLFFAPIGPSPQRVYDVATGTGIWAIQFGKLKLGCLGFLNIYICYSNRRRVSFS